MRQFICLLLVFCLSWVTTGFACRMDGLCALRAVCCCPHAHARVGHEPAVAKPAIAVDVADEGPRCCEGVASAARDPAQPGLLTLPLALDLPVFALLPAKPWTPSGPVARPAAAHPPVRGPPPGSGTRTYLSTARLRL